MFRARQALDTERIEDVRSRVRDALNAPGIKALVKPGMKVALTAGSRGIDRIDQVLGAAVEWLRGQGAEPFIVAAMGSHGGGAEQGRVQVLEELGITQESINAPVRADGETEIAGNAEGVPVHVSRAALEADGIMVVNRVKPHTSYSGKYESGLAKMLAVGLGMEAGASALHSCGAGALSGLVPKMVPGLSRKNALASTFLERVRVPLAFPSDREAIMAAIKTCGHPETKTLKLARIRDTLHLEELLVSEALKSELAQNAEVIHGPIEWDIDPEGNIEERGE